MSELIFEYTEIYITTKISVALSHRASKEFTCKDKISIDILNMYRVLRKNCPIPIFVQVFIIFSIVSNRDERNLCTQKILYTIVQLCVVCLAKLLAITLRVQKMFLPFKSGNILQIPCR